MSKVKRTSKIPEYWRNDPHFIKIKAELDPLANGFFSLAKMDRRYIEFKSSLDDWNKRFAKTLPTQGAVDSLQRLAVPVTKESKEADISRLITVTNLFRYLGLVESFGTQFVDLIILLLVANGYEFHVERQHDVPRIVHAASLEDLRNMFLGPKVRFLERCNLKETSKLVDVDLRNSIAHLDFEVNDNATVSARSHGEKKKEINIFQKIRVFYRKITILFLLFNEIQEHVFKPEKRLIAVPKKKKEENAG